MTFSQPFTSHAFADAVKPYRRELHVHAYRMLGSFHDAEDAVQETLFRAWKNQASFDGSQAFRAWLYRIATNVCIDAIRRSNRRPNTRTLESTGDVPWIQPYPDRLLDELTAHRNDEPHTTIVDRESIELTYLAIIQLLPPRQRAVLILRDVLDFGSAEVASHLETSVAAVNSALQRARRTLKSHPPHGRTGPPPSQPTKAEYELLKRFIDAHERADATAVVELLTEDARVTMPPHPFSFIGREAIAQSLIVGLSDPGEWRLVPTTANRSPAAASYLRPWGASSYEAFKIDVLRIEHQQIIEITTFDAALIPYFGLPATISEDEQFHYLNTWRVEPPPTG